MYFSAFPEEFSVMRCWFFLFLKKCLSFSQRSFSSILCKVLSQGITSWGSQSSAMNRPPPPPAGQPGASLPHPEKAVHWEMCWKRNKVDRGEKVRITGTQTRGQITTVQLSNTNKRWCKPHVTTHMGWLTWDRDRLSSRDRVQAAHKSQVLI